ncbi:MAG: potassium transporter TrkG [Paracoccus sp. (in: a-proteobacteria)]|uniref:potassium transporter TrkG n=1 Tax=Paracoccus sp. TaxID=267 RepID=UPI0026E0D387|nr:potassium transporter TrkG [Paracoccus sp. (in: a-proteobacteria)]MDO5620426.1 potassium transporter TrkG [Paracoccus sp. (in: a-proteobacteria)]
MSVLIRLPLLVVLMLVGAALMWVPAIHAGVLRDYPVSRAFLYSGLIFLTLGGMIGLASARMPSGSQAFQVLVAMLGAMVVLPLMLAVPFAESLPDTGLLNAWWEMVSALTTTGASLYAPDRLPPSLHLWRGLVGWMGGLFILVAAIAILAPLHVGGFELMAWRQNRSQRFERQEGGKTRPHLILPGRKPEADDPVARVLRAVSVVFPVYAGLTLVLWVVLLMAGDTPLVALCHAMGTISTSGISATEGPVGQRSGMIGELAIFLLMIPALSRRFWPGGGELRTSDRGGDDPELRLAAGIILTVTVVLLARHFFGAIRVGGGGTSASAIAGFLDAASAAWGAAFNALSYMTTTGWSSTAWEGARNWSGLSAPGLMLAGLAIMGGGVATTAGGVKLLRVYALAQHGRREMERMIHPHSIGGGGDMARHLREKGAFLAFVFFMLFAVTLAVTVVLVSVHAISFDSAVILSIAALTNTGQLASSIPLNPVLEGGAGVAGAPWAGWAGLPDFTKAVLAGTMVVGRLEVLAILALFSPEFWRR